MNITLNTQRNITFALAFFLPLVILFLPLEYIPIDGITHTQQRILAIFFLAAYLWIFEPIPNFSTSVLVIVLELVLVSDKGLIWLRSSGVGELLHYKTIMASFASPIILLFIGGFSLALAIQKNKIDFVMANALLKPFGSNPKIVLLGLMIITAIFSMFMSNTATTAMMISILMPVIGSLPREDRIRSAFAIGVPFAANIGGIGTPIGTPPNSIAIQFLPDEYKYNFSQWMAFAIPYVVVVLLITWLALIIVFKTQTKSIEVKTKESDEVIPKRNKIIVYSTFAATVFLWITDFWHGMNSYIVAMIPLVVFFILGILKKKDLQEFNWDVLWLVSGGIAIGIGMRDTGLAANIVSTFNLTSSPMMTILLVSVFISYLLSNFMSHTAASNLFFPILITVVINNQQIMNSGLHNVVILMVVFASSLSMILPISTPPNALGYATGLITTKQMASLGLFIGVVGIIIAYFYLYFVATATNLL